MRLVELTDEERALIAAMLRGLVDNIVDELIAGLPAMLAAQAEKGRDGLYRRLRASGLMERQGLLALLLRRADEQQLSVHADKNYPAVASLVSDDSAPVAEAAMATPSRSRPARGRAGSTGRSAADAASGHSTGIMPIL